MASPARSSALCIRVSQAAPYFGKGRARRTPISHTHLVPGPRVVRVPVPDPGRAMGTVWDLAGRRGVPS